MTRDQRIHEYMLAILGNPAFITNAANRGGYGEGKHLVMTNNQLAGEIAYLKKELEGWFPVTKTSTRLPNGEVDEYEVDDDDHAK